MNYILGPEELQLVYGVQEYNASIPVLKKVKDSVRRSNFRLQG
jgi:hypothetical protein